MRYLFYGDGNALEQLCYRRFAASLPAGDTLRFALRGGHALLRQIPGVVPVNSVEEAISLAQRERIDLVLTWSPAPIMAGVCDRFHAAGFEVFGLSAAAAHIETSKIIGKSLMRAHNVPTATSWYFDDPRAARAFLDQNWRQNQRQFVIKTDGFLANAAHRVTVPATLSEARSALSRVMARGGAETPPSAIIEERLYGRELSLHLLYDGRDYCILPPVSDHKRLFDGDQGPNTQGMGAVSTPALLSDDESDEIHRLIVEPTLAGIEARGLPYRYVLYIGVMLTEDGPRVLEYNTRPGSPEWLTLLALLDTPLVDLVHAVREQRLDRAAPQFRRERSAASLFAVSAGYPFVEREHGESITGLDQVDDEVWLCGEGIAQRDDALVVDGGRVFSLTAEGATLERACARIYEQVERVRFNGMFYRSDIGARYSRRSAIEPGDALASPWLERGARV
ncbi:phosphoribosylamine--glycine ligase [Haliangium ochraceum]|uniref:phosphoribosylamine--glycine ligase n=1 Tax=Haliangium ochraceum (strain DSM 14365 / JCM 11303 / SMP-2) TaxID=502025 RepID=D0LS97_HALO1|nr:phosphoribosylamine--glycine ligase [Haliangium ochraceum]ACY15596.1 phosphoribosylamine/glycine ligase [Haliangium ochraceum DSM 14365]